MPKIQSPTFSLSTMAAKWPSAFVARSEVERFSGGIVKPSYLANLDCLGKGPAGRIRIGRRYDLEINMVRVHAKHIVSDESRQSRQPVYGYQVHEVNQEYPDKNGECHRSNKRVSAGKCAFDAAIGKLDNHLDEILHTAGHTRGRSFRYFSEKVKE